MLQFDLNTNIIQYYCACTDTIIINHVHEVNGNNMNFHTDGKDATAAPSSECISNELKFFCIVHFY